MLSREHFRATFLLLGAANENLPVSVTSKILRLQHACLNAGSKQGTVPAAMSLSQLLAISALAGEANGRKTRMASAAKAGRVRRGSEQSPWFPFRMSDSIS